MALTINHNLMAMNTARNLGTAYGGMATSVQRLSSGLRVGTAADDAAGLAIRELMRADIKAINQGIRNANDAISMIQVADGALGVIDEKLIRMKELAMQASTGTYSSDQRLMINDEFQAMALEIQRISEATDFNGIKLLDGNLSGSHNGTSMYPTGASKIHFGSGNDSAEDYYQVNIQGMSLLSLGLATEVIADSSIQETLGTQNVWIHLDAGIAKVGSIPVGARNVSIILESYVNDNDLQVFTRSGKHLVGTSLDDYVWTTSWFTVPPNNITQSNVNTVFINQNNGFYSNAAYDDSSLVNGRSIPYSYDSPHITNDYNNEMAISYTGDGDINNNGHTDDDPPGANSRESVTIDYVSEELIVFAIGGGGLDVRASWDTMENRVSDSFLEHSGMKVQSIATQELAQAALSKVDAAMIHKDKVRANLGAMQNRLENTITNLSIQAENLQASESRISDADVSQEMTEFVREQILAQSATAMLAQANSFPKMALQLIQG